MAGSVNKAIIIGNLGKDPEVRNFQNGGKVVNLRIATSETYKDREGNRQERTEWHAVAIFNERIGEIAEKYLRKGSKVYIEGKIETRKWQDQAGVEKYTTEIVLRQFQGELTMLSGREGGEMGESGGGGYERAERSERSSGSGGGGGFSRSSSGGGAERSSAPKPQRSGGWDAPKSGGGGASDLDDDIPF